MKKTSVLLLSHDEAIRQQWLQISAEVWGIETATTTEQALQWAQKHDGMIVVDAALVDVTSPIWQQLFSESDVLVGSAAPNDVEGQKMIVAGAKAYFHSYSSANIMTKMLQHVQNNHIWIGQSLLSRLLSQVSEKLPEMTNSWKKDLTPREIEIAQRVSLGHGNQLIADDLTISERTVRAHLSSIFEKLQVSDRLMLTLVVHGIQQKNNTELSTI